MSTVEVKKKKQKKKEREKTENSEDVSSQLQVQNTVLMLVNQVSNLSKIVMDLKNNSSVSREQSKALDDVESKLDETLDQLSPKKTKKAEKNPQERSTVLAEDYYEKQLSDLAKIYNEQKKLYGSGAEFEKRGWPKIQKRVKKLSKKIDPNFMPRSKKTQHKFKNKDIDHNGEKYLKHCKNLVKKNVRVVKSSTDGNCLPFAISLGLNGDGNAQKNELRCRGAMFYALYYRNIYTHGQQVGWANTTGTKTSF